jgi:hypothetical protein
MNYVVEMVSVAMIHKPSFIHIGSGIQKLTGWIQTHGEHGDLVGLFLFFQYRK